MRFVDDDAFRRDGEEVLAVALTLDVVQADHDNRVMIEQADAMGKIAFDAAGAGGR